MKAASTCLAAFLGIVAPASSEAHAEPPAMAPPAMGEARLEQKLGAHARLEVELEDHRGRHVELGELVTGDKPVILVLAYYRCPMLCGLTLRGVARSLSSLSWDAGDDYQIVTVSFDPRDDAEAAARARKTTLEELGKHVGEEAWPFLTGTEAEIRKLTDSVGFHYVYDAKTDQYAHPNGVFVLTPDGEVSRVLQGFDDRSLDFRMALIEAGKGKIGTIAEQVLLTCYRYDPTKRRYGPWIVGFLRIGAIFVLLMVGLTYALIFHRARRRAQREREEGLR